MDAKERGNLQSEHTFSASEIKETQDRLLRWYRGSKRDLPWRRQQPESGEEASFDIGYRVWVSEIMLQQTRVQTVIEYYNRWLLAFPTITALAQASLEQVNELWAGLGYYRRAKLLHEGAKVVMGQWGGHLPTTVPDLLRIPGIGPYTAGAIASIAFEKKVPIVDGNVIRVLSRLRKIGGNPKSKEASALHWSLAKSLVETVPDGCAGDFNQGLMELGAKVCMYPTPSCSVCPLFTVCMARNDFAYTENRSKVGKREPKTQVSLTAWFPSQNEKKGEGVAKKEQGEATNPPTVLARAHARDCAVCSQGVADIEDLVDSPPPQYFPVKAAKGVPRNQIVFVSVVERMRKGSDGSERAEYLLVQRPEGVLLASFWEFPTIVLKDETRESTKKKEERRGNGNGDSGKRKRSNTENVEGLGVKCYEEWQGKQNEYFAKLLAGDNATLAEEVTALRGECVTDVGMAKPKSKRKRTYSQETLSDPRRAYIGFAKHLFSHISQTLHVEFIRISSVVGQSEKQSRDCEDVSCAEADEDDIKLNEEEHSTRQQSSSNTQGREKPSLRWLSAEELQQAAVSKGSHKCFEMVKQYCF